MPPAPSALRTILQENQHKESHHSPFSRVSVPSFLLSLRNGTHAIRFGQEVASVWVPVPGGQDTRSGHASASGPPTTHAFAPRTQWSQFSSRRPMATRRVRLLLATIRGLPEGSAAGLQRLRVTQPPASPPRMTAMLVAVLCAF